MAKWRVIYITEIVVEAASKDDAIEIFSDLNLDNLESHTGKEIISSEYIEFDEVVLLDD